MAITIKDIAKRAGVSVTTVSRALNGYTDIRAATRKRVLEVAESMNYRPSAVARSLVMKKSMTLGFIISEMSRTRAGHHFLFDVIYGVNDRAAELGYDVILSATDLDRQEEVPYIELCQRRQLEGVILAGARIRDPYLKEVLDSSIPCVLIDIPLTEENCSHVTLDNRKGARMAVEHLIAHCHRRIGFVNGDREAFVSQERLQGYRDAMTAEGLAMSPEPVWFGDFGVESGREGVRRLMEKHSDLTAVFCANDLMALGAMQELAALGKRVPQDVSVFGFDDIDLTRYVSPAISTVHQPRYRFGCEAVDALVRLFGGGKGETVVLQPTLTLRDSSGRAVSPP